MADKATVTVGCRIPNGLRLHVQKRLHDKDTPTPEGTRLFDDMGFIDLAPFSANAAPGVRTKTESFTVVDKDLWDAWLAENEQSSIVTGGSVFKYEEPKPEEAKAEPAVSNVEQEHERRHEDLDEAELERRTRPEGDEHHEEIV